MNSVNKFDIQFIDKMGNDLRVVNAARVSFDKESKLEVTHYQDDVTGEHGRIWQLKDADKKLIRYLALHNHFTPFTHCMITLRETIPIFVARQRFKHTVGFSYNEVSRRYVDSEPDFYFPEKWRERAPNKKQGSMEDIFVDLSYIETATDYQDNSLYFPDELCDRALSLYNSLLTNNVAPEQARMMLPQNMMTSYYVTGSLYAFAHAYELRNHETAQKEIRDLADTWDYLISPHFPVSWHFLKNKPDIIKLQNTIDCMKKYNVDIPEQLNNDYNELYEVK